MKKSVIKIFMCLLIIMNFAKTSFAFASVSMEECYTFHGALQYVFCETRLIKWIFWIDTEMLLPAWETSYTETQRVLEEAVDTDCSEAFYYV